MSLDAENISESNSTTESEQSVDFAKAIEESRSNIAASEEKPKRKRGRPRKSEVAAPAETPAAPVVDPALAAAFNPAILKPVVKMPFKAIAKARNCPAWELPEETADAVAPALDEIMKRYFPQMIGEHQAIAALVMLLGSHVVMAYMTEQQQRLDEQEKARAAQGSEQGSDNATIRSY